MTQATEKNRSYAEDDDVQALRARVELLANALEGSEQARLLGEQALAKLQARVDEVRRRCKDRVDRNPHGHGAQTTWITVADVLAALSTRVRHDHACAAWQIHDDGSGHYCYACGRKHPERDQER